MRLHRTNPKTLSMLALISISNMACGTDEAVSVPVCLDQISVENNTVLNAGDWSYGAGVNFRNATGFAMGSGVLLAEYKYPLIGVYNSHIKSVGGTVRPDDEIEDENLSILTGQWDIASLKNLGEDILYICIYLGDSNERPVREIKLYKPIPERVRTCTVVHKLKDGVQTRDNKLECFD